MRNGIFCACCATKGAAPPRRSWRAIAPTWGGARASISTSSWKVSEAMGLLGILVGLALLVWLAFRGWSVLLLAPAAALLAAAFAGEPLLANWTQTFMGAAA